MVLEELSLKHTEAFLTMLADYQDGDPETFIRLYKRAKPWNAIQFAAFVKASENDRMDWRPKAGMTSITRYVLLSADRATVLGNGVMRFPLDEELEREGGNLVFDVPPSQRGHNFGAITLNRMLFEAVRAGLARALVTCPSTNTHARKAIEMNRGALDAEIAGIARYWIPLR